MDMTYEEMQDAATELIVAGDWEGGVALFNAWELAQAKLRATAAE
jgi:hypothetical protein